ncbi:MAG: glycosyltransferase family 39 protein [Patescibacteria group bacterium]|jgi:hypothetical protein
MAILIQYLKRLSIHRDVIVLLLAAAFFVILTSYASTGLSARFVSPDETANYYFTKTFAQQGALRVAEPLNAVMPAIVAPRSMGIADGFLVPVSFIGLPLMYGLVAKVVGLWIIRYITPIIAMIGGLVFYWLIRRMFGRSIGLAAALLLFLHPAFWYFTARSMMHNASFVSLTIIAAYYFVRMISNGRFWSYGLFGLSLGAALLFRTVEGIWLIPLFGLLIVFAQKKLRWRLILVTLAGGALMIIPMLIINRQLYGSVFAFGYSPSAVASDSVTALVQGIGGKIGQALFPFGLRMGDAWHNWTAYYLRLFPWYGIPALIGWLWFLINWFQEWRKKVAAAPNRKCQRIYFVAMTLVSVWLIFYYGSWRIQEFENPNQLILGHSYIRYWLPVYIFGLPFVILGVREIINRLPVRLRRASAALIVLVFVIASMKLVVLDPLYGLAKVRADISEYSLINKQVQLATPFDAVVLAGKADKVVFPERSAIAQDPFTDEVVAQRVREIMRQRPVYYYCSFTEGWCQAGRTTGILNRGHFRLDKPTDLFHGNLIYRLSSD